MKKEENENSNKLIQNNFTNKFREKSLEMNCSVLQKLFYQKDFNQLQNELLKIQDPSLQETHNLCIAKYLLSGENPLPELKRLIASIKAETLAHGSWPSHPSFALLQYHVCLYYFRSSNYSLCIQVLNEIWENYEKLDKLLALCLSLLTIELAIRTGEKENVEKATMYIKTNFPNQDSISNILQSKGIEEQVQKSILQAVQFAPLRLEVSELVKQTLTDDKRVKLESILAKADITPDAKNRPPLPVEQVLPLACAALRIGDQMKFQTVLESADDSTNFAVLNNRGISELLQKRYSSALLHFTKSLNSRTNNELIYPFHQVAYNLGISLLMKHEPHSAFKFLYSIIPLMSKSPYLWLRLAECVVMYYKQRVSELRKEKQYNQIISQKLCTATRTYYVLPLPDSKLFEQYAEQTHDLTLDFAEKCTRNCISLCNGKPQLQSVQRAAELLCSFISLELGDGKRAADMGRAVSTDTNSEKQQQFLSKIYSAQGHLMIGECEEASKILSRLLIESDIKKEKDQQIRHSLTFARVAIATGDFQKAETQLQKATEQDPKRPEVVLTTIAYELQRRHLRQANAALNAYCSAQSD